MSAELIKKLLAQRYHKSGHAVFQEFRTKTGFSYGAHVAKYIDMVAVGLYDKNWGIKAFEVKIERGDFLTDVRTFKEKHGDALEISHEFYYVCPWRLIDKSEVPEIAGLMYVDNSNQIKTIKQAQVREMKEFPFDLFMAFAKEFGNKIKVADIPVKHLGKEISQKEFEDIVEEGARKKIDWIFEDRVKEKAMELQGKHALHTEFFRSLVSICWLYGSDQANFEAIKRLCEIGKMVKENSMLEQHLKTLRNDINKIMKLMEGFRSNENYRN